MSDRFFIFVFGIIELAFLIFVGMLGRGYQDTWILQDILLPTIIYVVTFIIVALSIGNNKNLVIVCSVFLMTLNAIPNLKYNFFSGVYDSAGHYGFAQEILNSGFVPSIGFYSQQYSDFPGMHIFVSTMSLMMGVDLVTAVKFVTSVMFGIIPFLFYFVTNGIFEKKVQKYILIASGLPATVMSSYLYGTAFAIIFLIAFFLILTKRNMVNVTKEWTLVLCILFFGLLFSHALTSLFLVLFLAMTLILLKIFGFLRRKRIDNLFIVKSLGILGITLFALNIWLGFKAGFLTKTISQVVQTFFSSSEVTSVPSTFFNLPIFDKLKIFSLYYASDIVFFSLTAIGFFVFIKKFLPKNKYVSEKVYIPFISLFMTILLFLGISFVTFGNTEYVRFIYYSLAFSALFVGLLLWSIDNYFDIRKRMRVKSIVLFIILLTSLLVSLIQIFPYQPLTPTGNVLSRNLPANEYITDFGQVNTIYQVEMIHFAEHFSPNNVRIASDTVTRWQIYGFASLTFADQETYFSVLQYNLTDLGTPWQICLLHYEGRAGPLNEFIANRTREVLDDFKLNEGNVVYDNGESFIISR